MSDRRVRSISTPAQRTLLPAAMLAMLCSAWTAAATPLADEATPLAAAPTSISGESPGFRSPYEDYRRYSPQALRPWPEVNHEVGRAGGWRAYAREIHEARNQADRNAATGAESQ